MKKLKPSIAVLTGLVVVGLSLPVLGTENGIKIMVNDAAIETEAVVIDGQTYVPARAVSEALGAEVTWDGETSTVSIDLESGDDLIPSIIEDVSPSVVGIIGTLKDEEDSSSSYQDQIAHGTGLIIKEDGEILTNAHVVEDMDTIVVVLSNGEGYQATLKSIDVETDLAVVKIEKDNLPVAVFADEEDIVSGKTVIAIGTPISFSLRNSASTGIISGVNRSIDSSYRLIQTDAAINPGNSGGPLVNLNGEVVGINSSKFSGVSIEGMGFSIPVDTVQYVISQFDAYGEVRRPYLGANFEEDWAARIGLPTNSGLTITYVKGDSPADVYGLLEGDVLLSIDDVSVNSTVDFNEVMKDYEVGSTVSCEIKRDGIKMDLVITLGSRQ